MIRLSPQMRSAIQRTTLPILVLLSAVFIVLGKADQLLFDSLRTRVSDSAAPVLDALARPLNAVNDVVDHVRLAVMTYQENVRLEAENSRLMQWQQAARNLAAENRELRGLLKAVPQTALSYVTAPVIANSGGAFVRMILINAGSEDHVSRGEAAITGEGLVGRLTEVGERASRVLLITDLNSRIPVTIESTHVPAVLAGDNSERPRLQYLPSAGSAKIGDRIITSGEGGVFPPGLPVGVVTAIDSTGPRVEPYVELSELSYVLVVDYGLARSLPQPLPMLSRPNKHARSAGEAAATH